MVRSSFPIYGQVDDIAALISTPMALFRPRISIWTAYTVMVLSQVICAMTVILERTLSHTNLTLRVVAKPSLQHLGGEVVAICKSGSGCVSSYPTDHIVPLNLLRQLRRDGPPQRLLHPLRSYEDNNLVAIGPLFRGGTSIGEMGTTSGCNTSTAEHLHFGVYCDDGNGKWDGEQIDRPVDPFGWDGRIMTPTASDPWVSDRGGPVSGWLWRYPEIFYCLAVCRRERGLRQV